MTCIKTGAIVHMKSHDLVFAADLFKVGTAIVIRSNGPLTKGKNAFAPGEHNVTVTHELASEAIYREEFWRMDLGVFVVDARRVTEVA